MKGKFEHSGSKRVSGVRMIALLLAVILLVGGVVGGTVAWLIDQTDSVVNTFTYGDINLKLEETDTELDTDNDPNTNDYEMVPGGTIVKDPVVTVIAGSEKNWLFVKLVKSDNFDTFMTYEIADGWTLMPADGDQEDGDQEVYYRIVEEVEEMDAEDQTYDVLKDNHVTVKGEVTKEMLNALDADGVKDYPKLTVTAYAVQYLGFEIEDNSTSENPELAAAQKAWKEIDNQDDATP